MQLNREQRQQFHAALLSAFPTSAKLRQMASFQLDENLDAIASGANLSETVFNLIAWAESEGKLEELLRGARQENSGNPKLRAFDEQTRAALRTELQNPTNTASFDVFLAHNSQDKPQVKAIAKELKRRGLKPWLDDEQIPPGRSFQDEIQQAIPLVKAAAIFLGLQGLGRWQSWELKALMSKCVEKNIPVIPVLLPGVEQIPEHLIFLKEFSQVQFNQQVDDLEALDRLVWGITGKNPHQ